MSRIIAPILFLALLISTSSLFAQDEWGVAAKNIRTLKNGALLVRLHSKQRNIEALREKGRESQAQQIEMKQRAENLELVQAFRSQFNFCPVYFFYSDQSQLFLDDKLEEVVFVNDSLEKDPSIKPELDGFLTAELALVQQNTDRKYENRSGSNSDSRNQTGDAKYYGKPNMRFHALIVKDERFNQLERPFPYYSRTLSSIFLKKSMDEVVKTLNKKLIKFLNQRG